MMRTVKVLFLERLFFLTRIFQDLANRGICLEIMSQGDLGEEDTYKSSPLICQKINEVTANKKVDLVVIANNQYVGVSKAKAVAEGMKDRTIIVWTKYVKGDEDPYARLGFTKFGSRDELPQMIAEMLGASAAK